MEFGAFRLDNKHPPGIEFVLLDRNAPSEFVRWVNARSFVLLADSLPFRVDWKLKSRNRNASAIPFWIHMFDDDLSIEPDGKNRFLSSCFLFVRESVSSLRNHILDKFCVEKSCQARINPLSRRVRAIWIDDLCLNKWKILIFLVGRLNSSFGHRSSDYHFDWFHCPWTWHLNDQHLFRCFPLSLIFFFWFKFLLIFNEA